MIERNHLHLEVYVTFWHNLNGITGSQTVDVATYRCQQPLMMISYSYSFCVFYCDEPYCRIWLPEPRYVFSFFILLFLPFSFFFLFKELMSIVTVALNSIFELH